MTPDPVLAPQRPNVQAPEITLPIANNGASNRPAASSADLNLTRGPTPDRWWLSTWMSTQHGADMNAENVATPAPNFEET
eukprot:4404654-Heterocapsa_arctica.AAC.1